MKEEDTIDISLTGQHLLIRKNDVIEANLLRGDDENDDVWFGRCIVEIVLQTNELRE